MFLKRIKTGVRDHGILIYGVYVFKRMIDVLSKKILIQFVFLFVLPVDKNRIKIPLFIRKKYDVQVLRRYHKMLDGFPVSRKTMDFRFSQDALCFVLLKDQNPIGFLWLILGRYEEDIVYCDLVMDHEIAWDFDLWIHDHFRLSPAFSLLWQSAFEYLDGLGVKYIFSRISTLNNNSVGVHTRLGGCIVGKLFFIQYRGFEICMDSVLGKLSLHTRKKRKTIRLRSVIGSKSLGNMCKNREVKG